MSKTDEDSVSRAPDTLILRFEGPDEFGDYNIVSDADALAIGAVVSNMRPPAVTAAHARRLVACWNGCTGLSTKDLEADPATNLLSLHVDRADAAEASKIELAEHLDKTIATAADAVNRAGGAEARLQRIAGIMEGSNDRAIASRKPHMSVTPPPELTMTELAEIYEAAKLDEARKPQPERKP